MRAIVPALLRDLYWKQALPLRRKERTGMETAVQPFPTEVEISPAEEYCGTYIARIINDIIKWIYVLI